MAQQPGALADPEIDHKNRTNHTNGTPGSLSANRPLGSCFLVMESSVDRNEAIVEIVQSVPERARSRHAMAAIVLMRLPYVMMAIGTLYAVITRVV